MVEKRSALTAIIITSLLLSSPIALRTRIPFSPKTPPDPPETSEKKAGQAPEIGSRSPSLRILRPSMAVSTILTRGSEMTVWAECLSATETTGWSVKLKTEYDEHRLDVKDSVERDGYWYVTASVPADLRPDLYDLVLSAENLMNTQFNAVSVRRAIPDNLTFVHITDTHVNNDTYDRIKGVFEEINLIHPDLVVISGDLVHVAEPEQYEMYIELVRELDVPSFSLIGNHDYANFMGFVNDPTFYEEFVTPVRDYSFDVGKYHFICMDSGHTVDWPYNSGSGLSDEQIRWLERDLETHRDSKATFFFMHHPSVTRDYNTAKINNNLEEFKELAREYDITMSFAGHVHWDAVYDITGDEKTGDVKEIDGPIFVETTCSGPDTPLYDHTGYRLIRARKGWVKSYTYDKDVNGIRDAASSIPSGGLHLSFLPNNTGTEGTVTARIRNDLAENFDNVFLKFAMPEPDPGLDHVALNGTIEERIGEDGRNIYYVRSDVEALSVRNVTLYQADIRPPVVGTVVAREDGVIRTEFGNGAEIEIRVTERNGEDNLTGTITATSEEVGVVEHPLVDDGSGRYYYKWNTSGSPSGSYEIEIGLTDRANNTDPDGLKEGPDLVIDIDNTPPEIQRVLSAAGEDTDGVYERGSGVDITVVAQGDEVNLSGRVRVKKDGSGKTVVDAELTEIGVGVYNYSWDTGDSTCGFYRAKAFLRDNFGNSMADIREPPGTLIKLIDTTPPVISSVSTLSGEDGDGTYPAGEIVTVRVTEERREEGLEGRIAITDVEGRIWADNGLNETEKPGVYVFAWNTGSVPAGLYFVKISLGDRWGNTDRFGLSDREEATITLVDSVRPRIGDVSPPDGGAGVGVGTPITVRFNEGIAPDSFKDAFSVRILGGGEVEGRFEYVEVEFLMVFRPLNELVRNTTYECTVSNVLTDVSGNGLGKDHTWLFKTEGPLPSNDRPTLADPVPDRYYVYALPNETLRFSITGRDGDMLLYRWYDNDELIAGNYGNYLIYEVGTFPENGPVTRVIKVAVSDGELTASRDWVVVVNGTAKGDDTENDGKGSGERDSRFSSVDRTTVLIMFLLFCSAVMISLLAWVIRLRGRRGPDSIGSSSDASETNGEGNAEKVK